ncbi:MAG: hypothetical protein D6736_03815 [Nitrospinota bacterium]|nr:MAG: hypothetical protein D6736_03815 [Nitrospinota bacterium]
MRNSNPQELFAEMMARPEEEIDLATAALLIAQQEYPSLSIARYLHRLDAMAAEVSARLGTDREPYRVIERLNHYLFAEQGFRGNREQYYDPRNSFLNEVLDRRTGIPITLALVYMEIGKRIDLPIEGIGFPGHFLIGYRTGCERIFLDPFQEGTILQEQDCQDLLYQIYGQRVPFQKSFLSPLSKKQFLTRMLNNLKQIYLHLQAYRKAITITDYLLLVNPQAYEEIRDRGIFYYQLKAYPEALSELSRYLQSFPEARDASVVYRNVRTLRRLIGMLN